MKTLRAVEEIKHLMADRRGELIQEKSSLMKRWESGINFFLSTKDRSRYDIEKASQTMRSISVRLDEITKEIYDLDVIIGTKLEDLFSDFEIRISIPQRTDESGSKHESRNVLVGYSDEEKVTITPEDLWSLKILKQALNYRNIEVLKRKE